MHKDAHVRINPKAKHYHNDGTGRDTYISEINGGILSNDKIHEIN
jgi:hypothetical protein